MSADEDEERGIVPPGAQQTTKRPWCCPEPRCTPLTHVANGDITQFESGESWWCWGAMAEPVTFIYDGNEHTNDFNSCFYGQRVTNPSRTCPQAAAAYYVLLLAVPQARGQASSLLQPVYRLATPITPIPSTDDG